MTLSQFTYEPLCVVVGRIHFKFVISALFKLKYRKPRLTDCAINNKRDLLESIVIERLIKVYPWVCSLHAIAFGPDSKGFFNLNC